MPDVEEPRGANDTVAFDYSKVSNPARIAVYDDLQSDPHIIDIPPATTTEFLESLSVAVHTQCKQAGGAIPYSIIRQIVENFIHAEFREMTVSIYDGGNTIRFADQGPGISSKEKAEEPGFSSATAEMKNYILGVGSGLPRVKDYMDIKNGRLEIDDNLKTGAVVTLSLKPAPSVTVPTVDTPAAGRTPFLDDRERDVLAVLKREGPLGNNTLADLLSVPNSSMFNILSKMEEAGTVVKLPDRRRAISDYGTRLLENI